MFSNASSNDFNREYVYVRRLISVLTNDNSDKLIVEKLKGKNLSYLLYNAKIIDNSKNMTANKKILACVIRAIEREKNLCRRRELEQSWGRKFLNSFNCLHVGLRENENNNDAFSNCQRKSSKEMKHRPLSSCARTSSTRRTSCKNVYKSPRNSSMRCAKAAAKENQFRDKPYSSVEGFNQTYSCIDSIISSKLDDDLGYWKVCQQVPISYVRKYQKIKYVTIRPQMLRQRKLSCVMIYPERSLSVPVVRRFDRAEKRTSATQTSDSSDPDTLLKVPNCIKLQDLLEAARNLLSRRDKKEYIQAFLDNFEPPFDFSSGFPPYLKLPMNPTMDAVGDESVYGANSEISLISEPVLQPQTYKEVIKQKEENVRKYVRELMMTDPWPEQAESIISGVITENLPLHKDFSQLGACILKGLGALPDSNPTRNKQNPNISELILQCTEFFESGLADQENAEASNHNIGDHGDKESQESKEESPSVVEISLTDGSNLWGGQKTQNYCFLEESANQQEIGLLNLSESSLVGIGTHQGENDEEEGDHKVQDRKNLRLREPLQITPSGLEQASIESKRGIFKRRFENKGMVKALESKRLPALKGTLPDVNVKESVGNVGTRKLSKFTMSDNDQHQENRITCCDNRDEPLVKINKPVDNSVTIKTVSILKKDREVTTQPALAQLDDDVSARIVWTALPPEITETATPPPEPVSKWELAADEPELYNGVGEALPMEQSMSKSGKNQISINHGRDQEKNGGRKKCKLDMTKKKQRRGWDPSEKCIVM